MAQRINITISDDLHNRLQAVKDGLNISRICQEAIKMEVEISELKAQSGKEAVVSRLRLQKEQHDEVYEQMGRKDGLKDAEKMDYDELLEVINAGVTQHSDAWHNYLHDALYSYEKEYPAFDRDAYVTGWVKSVAEFFEEIREDL